VESCFSSSQALRMSGGHFPLFGRSAAAALPFRSPQVAPGHVDPPQTTGWVTGARRQLPGAKRPRGRPPVPALSRGPSHQRRPTAAPRPPEVCTQDRPCACSGSPTQSECCPICLEPTAGAPCSVLPCLHRLHETCLRDLRRSGHNRCPLCKSSADTGSPIRSGAAAFEGWDSGNDEDEDVVCCVCGAGDRADELLLCDTCDAGHHLSCLTPPLAAVPQGDWHCPRCVRRGKRRRPPPSPCPPSPCPSSPVLVPFPGGRRRPIICDDEDD